MVELDAVSDVGTACGRGYGPLPRVVVEFFTDASEDAQVHKHPLGLPMSRAGNDFPVFGFRDAL